MKPNENYNYEDLSKILIRAAYENFEKPNLDALDVLERLWEEYDLDLMCGGINITYILDLSKDFKRNKEELYLYLKLNSLI